MESLSLLHNPKNPSILDRAAIITTTFLSWSAVGVFHVIGIFTKRSEINAMVES
jgi:hypothetical protein